MLEHGDLCPQALILPLSPGGVKGFVHQRAGVNPQYPIGRCYVTAHNVAVQAAQLHETQPFVCHVTGRHNIVSDGRLGKKKKKKKGDTESRFPPWLHQISLIT